MGNSASSEFITAAAALRDGPAPEDDQPGCEIFFSKLIPAGASLSAIDVFSVIQPEHIREMKVHQPRNLARAIIQCIDIIEQSVNQPDTKHYRRVMNAARLLTRVVPIVFEDDDPQKFAERVFWENQIPSASAPQPAGVAATTTEAAGTEVPRPLPQVSYAVRAGTTPSYPLGLQFVNCTMALLFQPDLTIDGEAYEIYTAKIMSARGEANGPHEGDDIGDLIPDEANAVWPMLLWKAGPSFPGINPAWNATHASNRVEVLRLILALACQPLYSQPVPQSPTRSKFIDHLVGPSCPFAPTLFYSLLNTVLAYDPVGWGVPYVSALLGDKEEPLVNVAAQTLLVLLDYAPTATEQAPPPPETGSEGEPPKPALEAEDRPDVATPAAAAAEDEEDQAAVYAQFNIYRSLLAGISAEPDLDLLHSGIVRLLTSIPYSEGTLLPGAVRSISCGSEVLVLFWKLLDENQGFLHHVLTNCDVTETVTTMLYLMWAGRNNVTKVGLVHLCTFIMLLLSGERAFGVGLNKPFASKLPLDLPLFEGSHADLLIIVLHKIIIDGSPKLSTLYSCFLTIIANISSYTKALSLIASVKLVNMFELFSSPRFLFARPMNYTFSQQLVETFNNIIQYQYESNGTLVYTILRRREVFERVSGLTVESWKRLESLKAAKRQTQAALTATTGDSKDSSAGQQPGEKSPAKIESPSEAKSENIAVDQHHAAVKEHAVDEAEWAQQQTTGSEGDLAAEPISTITASADANADAAPAASAAAGSEPASGETSRSRTGTGDTGNSPAGSGSAWAPTDQWWSGVKKHLPLTTVLRMISYLQPLIEHHLRLHDQQVDDEGVVTYIKSTTLVGILPVPHPILMRKYQPNQYTALWFTTYIWSTVYLHLCKELPMFDAEAIKLFQITIV